MDAYIELLDKKVLICAREKIWGNKFLCDHGLQGIDIRKRSIFLLALQDPPNTEVQRFTSGEEED
uniref:Uncharacterized protein n=1 Tax=Lepeophtheirus salmonis TaxID=72036 RepID=A0A0K2TTZ0_LEPSM